MNLQLVKRISFCALFAFQAYAVLGAVGTLSAFLIYYDAAPEFLSYIISLFAIFLWHPDACIRTFIISALSLIAIIVYLIRIKERFPPVIVIVTLIITALNTMLYGYMSMSWIYIK